MCITYTAFDIFVGQTFCLFWLRWRRVWGTQTDGKAIEINRDIKKCGVGQKHLRAWLGKKYQVCLRDFFERGRLMGYPAERLASLTWDWGSKSFLVKLFPTKKCIFLFVSIVHDKKMENFEWNFLRFLKVSSSVMNLGLGKVLVYWKGGGNYFSTKDKSSFPQRPVVVGLTFGQGMIYLIIMLLLPRDGQCLRTRNKHCLVWSDHCLLFSLFSRAIELSLSSQENKIVQILKGELIAFCLFWVQYF